MQEHYEQDSSVFPIIDDNCPQRPGTPKQSRAGARRCFLRRRRRALRSQPPRDPERHVPFRAYRYVCTAGSLGPARDPPVAHPATSATLNSGWRRSPGTGTPSRAADSSGASANMPASIREAERALDAPRPAEVEEAR
jgi:hypothetical protein